MLDAHELSRYSRHLLMPELGREGQERLKQSSVLIVGAGGLGTPLAMYLAAAGVGTLGIVEYDAVDQTNLHRQLLYEVQDVGSSKLDAAIRRLRRINPHIDLVPMELRLDSSNALDLVRAFDVVADGTDNFATRYLINDASVLTGVPNVYGSIFRFDGQVSVFGSPDGPCYRCLYPEPPPPGLVPSCAEGGVLGVLPGIVGTLQATEVLKQLLGIGEPLVGRLLLIDALEMSFQEMRIRRDPRCAICGEQPTVTELIDYEDFCGLPATLDGAGFADVPHMSVEQLHEAKERPTLLDVRRSEEAAIASLGGLFIPLAELPNRMDELSSYRDERLVVYCRTGARSASAAKLLQDAGFTRVFNLEGGIRAWADRIDGSVPKY